MLFCFASRSLIISLSSICLSLFINNALSIYLFLYFPLIFIYVTLCSIVIPSRSFVLDILLRE